MTLVALDVNATRVRVLTGLSPRETRPLALEGTEVELPLAVSLEGRTPVPGRAGAALCRRSPHLACTGFLAHLGERREWAGPRCKVDASLALAAVLDLVSARAGKHNAAAVAIPGYLSHEQRAVFLRVGENARLRLHGSIDSGLAAALAALSSQPLEGLALVVDVDDHALTWTAITALEGTAHVSLAETHASLSLRAWKERLLGAVADACVRCSRRDPRDSADAEQSLYDQLDAVLQASREGRPASVLMKTAQWSQNVNLNASDLAAACKPLLEATLGTFTAISESAGVEAGPVRVVVVTTAASRLPGLVGVLERELAEQSLQGSDSAGETAPPHVQVLDPDAVAQAVHELAARWHREKLPPGHLDVVPLLEAQSPATGYARLQFRGRDQSLRSPVFMMGRDPRCDLPFDTNEYPSVSGMHCKIVHDTQGFTLHDLSRHGTFVNDHPVVQQRELRPGDWIRLGPAGPLLRFLGQAIDKRKLMPTA